MTDILENLSLPLFTPLCVPTNGFPATQAETLLHNGSHGFSMSVNLSKKALQVLAASEKMVSRKILHQLRDGQGMNEIKEINIAFACGKLHKLLSYVRNCSSRQINRKQILSIDD